MRFWEVNVNLVMSMTGYGKGEYENEFYRCKIEIKSVNHRYIDINVRSPRQISYLEEKVKKQVKQALSRGKIEVYIDLDYLSGGQVEVEIDNELASSYYGALQELKVNLNLNDEVSLDNVLNMPDIIRTRRRDVDEDIVWEALENALDKALNEISEMRQNEGQELKDNILFNLTNIGNYINIIEERSPKVVEEYRIKLNERIEGILEDDVQLDNEKLSIEVAFFADKADINEEIVRLKSHIKQLNTILNDGNSIGRKLDFLIQEFNREINTIGSKSSDTIITSYVVELKSEIEKIREQIQNIE